MGTKQQSNTPEMVTTTETITPQIAAEMMQHNWGNRPLVTSYIKILKQQMLEGKFRLSPEGIVFAQNGRLLDGQNRLQAVIESGVTVQMRVTRYKDDDGDIFAVLNTGKMRNAVDVLHSKGHRYAGTLSAAVKLEIAYRKNIVTNERNAFSQKAAGVTNEMVYEYVLSHPEIEKSVEFAHHMNSKKIHLPLQPATTAFLHYLLSGELSEKFTTEFFLEKFITGVGLEGDSPIHLGRQHILRNSESRKMVITDKINVVLYTWNCWAQGKSLTVFRMPKLEPHQRYLEPLHYKLGGKPGKKKSY